jgi:hypothetical protein
MRREKERGKGGVSEGRGREGKERKVPSIAPSGKLGCHGGKRRDRGTSVLTSEAKQNQRKATHRRSNEHNRPRVDRPLDELEVDPARNRVYGNGMNLDAEVLGSFVEGGVTASRKKASSCRA